MKKANACPWKRPQAVPLLWRPSCPAAMRLVHAGIIDLPTLWRAMSFNPASRLGLPSGRLSVGAPADLVLFDPNAPFVMDRATLKSKSRNTPFDGQRMQGKVIATYVRRQQSIRNISNAHYRKLSRRSDPLGHHRLPARLNPVRDGPWPA